MMAFANVLFGFSPIVKLFTSNFTDFTLPHQIWLPFEITNVTRFLSAHFVIFIIIIISDVFMLCSDLLLNGLIVVLSLEFDMLGDDLEKFNTSNGLGDIKKLVNRHCKLLGISKKLESIFSVSNFCLFIGSSLLLCFPAFQVVSAEESLTIMKFLVYFLTALLQVYLTCHYGDKLEKSSLRVADKVMMSEWYDCDETSVKLSLSLIHLRALRPAKLTALKFSDISINTFATVRKNIFKIPDFSIFIF